MSTTYLRLFEAAWLNPAASPTGPEFRSRPQPPVSHHQAKADATTAAARAIIDEESQRRDEKTARLRAARLKG